MPTSWPGPLKDDDGALPWVVSDHLGVDAETVPVTQDSFPEHRLADADIALNKLAEDSGGTLIGV